MRPVSRKPSGLTIFELLISLAIVSLTAVFGAPHAQHIVYQARVTAELNQLNGLFRSARFEAIDQQTTLTLCPTDDMHFCKTKNWQLPLMVFEDRNVNGKRDTDESILYASDVPHPMLNIQGPAKHIKFYGDGLIASTATIKICALRGSKSLDRALILSLQGRVRLSQDYNGDEIHEVRPGKIVTC